MCRASLRILGRPAPLRAPFSRAPFPKSDASVLLPIGRCALPGASVGAECGGSGRACLLRGRALEGQGCRRRPGITLDTRGPPRGASACAAGRSSGHEFLGSFSSRQVPWRFLRTWCSQEGRKGPQEPPRLPGNTYAPARIYLPFAGLSVNRHAHELEFLDVLGVQGMHVEHPGVPDLQALMGPQEGFDL